MTDNEASKQGETDTTTADQHSSAKAQLTDLVSPDRVKIWEDPQKVLHVSVDDKTFEDVWPRRVFPLSGKANYVSFAAKGNEVLLLADPQRLEQQSRRVLRKALDHTYYLPQILRVDEISEAMGVSMWRVQTDRGYATFEIVDRQRYIRILPRGRYLLSDVDGNRYEIADVSKLDQRSQDLIAHET